MKCLSFECSQLGVELDLVTDVLDSSECPLKWNIPDIPLFRIWPELDVSLVIAQVVACNKANEWSDIPDIICVYIIYIHKYRVIQ